jgi:hypothetical protein
MRGTCHESLVTALIILSYSIDKRTFNMTSKRIANLVLAVGLLSFGAASCDIVDPWDPGNGGGNGGGGNGGGCGDTVIVDDSADVVNATGVIHIVVSATGESFVGIDAADGQRYEPTNLYTDDFREGQRVKFSGRTLDWTSPNQYGKLIELTMLETID